MYAAVQLEESVIVVLRLFRQGKYLIFAQKYNQELEAIYYFIMTSVRTLACVVRKFIALCPIMRDSTLFALSDQKPNDLFPLCCSHLKLDCFAEKLSVFIFTHELCCVCL